LNKRFNHCAYTLGIEWRGIGAQVKRNTLGTTRGMGFDLISQAAFAAYGWLGAVAYAAFFAIDHLLALWSAHLYAGHPARLDQREQATPPARVSYWLLFEVTAWSAMIFVVWLWARAAPYGAAAFGVIFGWLAIPEIPASVRHVRNVLVLRGVIRTRTGPPGVTASPVKYEQAASGLLVTAATCLVLWLALRDTLWIGGVVGCFLQAGRYWDRAYRRRA